ncbi:hypothetical protein GUY59_14040, partial [Nonomuraea sp. K271]|nr:hypothetical protein [Nonomuraea sp. K271]
PSPNPYPPPADQPNPYAPPADQGNPYAPSADQQNPYAPSEAPSAFAPAEQAYPTAETGPNVPYPPPDGQQQYFGQSAFAPQQADQQAGQPFTGFSGQEYATPQAYQEPEPPVDPRSQQLMDAYQQAETYQHSSPGTQSELRVPDYAGQPPRAYDDPFGHPQQPQQQSGGYEPQQGQYQPGHQVPSGDATMRLDPSSFGPDSFGGDQRRPGDDPIDPTAIYTPNEPRR